MHDSHAIEVIKYTLVLILKKEKILNEKTKIMKMMIHF